MIIQNNIPGFNASRNKGITEGKMKKALEKLSTGYRINRAGDDAAGLAISELMRNQITALDQAMRNINDGISMTQTGDGALTEVHSMLERMKTLAIQAANGTYTTIARENIDQERQQLLEEIDRIGQTSNFDEIPLFDSAVQDADGNAIVFEPPQKSMEDPEITLQVGHDRHETLDVQRYYMGSKALLLNYPHTDFTSVTAANNSVPAIDAAIEAVADIRADFGAAQNHLEHTYMNISVTSENITTSESRIRDTDMADEFTNYTTENILFQAGNAMVAQANSIPGMILSLLQ